MSINKLATAFGDHSSLLPLFTKDVVNSAGMTAFSYDAGGKIEAKDRCIDEFGTQAIWLGGLPFYKWLSNKTIYKLAKINPELDVRLLQDKEQLSQAQKFADTFENKSVADSLADAVKHSAKAKGLFIGKFAAATALTLGSFFTLVKAKQHYTKKQIEKEFWAKKTEQHFMSNSLSKSPAFKAFDINGEQSTNKPVNSKNVSFKGLTTALSGFMFDPVKNLFIVDAGITGERLINSRTKTELAETAIKEGSLLFFLYVAGKYVQQSIEVISDKLCGKPIDMHAEVLDSSYLKSAIKDGSALKDVKALKELANDKNALFEYVYDAKNADNTVIKAAKHSGIIKTIVKGNWFDRLTGKAINTHVINPLKYINPKELIGIANDIEKLIGKAPENPAEIDKYLKQCRNMKIGSVAANMLVTCSFLGLIVPYTMMKYRANQQDGNKEFHVQSEIEKQLEKNFKARMV